MQENGAELLKAVLKQNSFASEDSLTLKQQKAMTDFDYSVGIVFE